MISDEPDEDADNLDDDTVLRAYLGVTAPGQAADGVTRMADWPPHSNGRGGLGIDLDADTLAWFKARHANWRSAMAGVLRAWVAARTRPDPDGPQRD